MRLAVMPWLCYFTFHRRGVAAGERGRALLGNVELLNSHRVSNNVHDLVNCIVAVPRLVYHCVSPSTNIICT